MKKMIFVAATMAVVTGGISGCTSSSVELREGGKMSFTYESPALGTDARKAFVRAQDDMTTICKLAGGLEVKFPVERPPVVIQPQPMGVIERIAVGIGENILRDLSGKTTVRLDGTCVGADPETQ